MQCTQQSIQIVKIMSEIKNYDIAACKFQKSLKLHSLPLNSWDLYAPFLDKTCKNHKDVTTLKGLLKTKKWAYTANFNAELFEKEHVIVLTDTELNIVHATHNVVHMNGYEAEEIIGKKPKMFQGALTCKKTAASIRQSVAKRQAFEAVILNYRKDGSTYNCWIKGEPVYDTTGKIVNFIAFEKEVA